MVCYWRIKVDDNDCPTGAIGGDQHVSANDNHHAGDTIVGLCGGLSAGSHTITAAVSGSGDCYTGWSSGGNVWAIEAMEVATDDPYLHMVNGRGSIDDRDSGAITGRTLTFNKQQDSSRLRILYYDNWRTLGTALSC